MKKAIAIFFVILMMKTVGFAQSSQLPEYHTNNTCVIGSPNLRTYADQMDKLQLTEQDSFLEEYKGQLTHKILPMYFTEPRFQTELTPPSVSKEKIFCAMKRIPFVSQTKKVCSSSAESGRLQNQLPCVTEQMVDYVHWGFNEALKCYGNLLDNYEKKMIFKKINHESAFGFFFQYKGGTGIAQLISGSQRDMFLPGYAGNSFLASHIVNNVNKCESFLKLLSRTAKTKSLNSCEFISVGDGIGRSLVGGIGLYLHYRSDSQNPYSAEKLLAYWGVRATHSEKYKQLRTYLTLGMYNKGPGAVDKSIKRKIVRGGLLGKNEEQAYNIVMNLIKKSSFYGYIRAVENSTNKIFDPSGNCKI